MVMSLLRNIDRNSVIFDFVKHTDQKGRYEDEIIKMHGCIYVAPRYRIYNHAQYIAWWKQFLRNHPEYRIIHGHFFTISALYFSMAQKEGRITIGHSHCTETPRERSEKKRIHYILSKLLVRRIEHYSDYAFACSKAAGEWVFKKMPFTILNNAIDAARFRADSAAERSVREEFNLSDSLVLGNVSRFVLQKNPHGTLEIFKQVHDKRPNSKLLWVGDGPMRAEVQAKAEAYGIQNDVIFTGVRSDVERLLQAMDAFVFPSFYEGLGIAAVEAQAAGVQTYCSSAIPGEVAVTDLCHFLPLDDLSAWADAIVQLPAVAPHPDMMEQIVKAGYDIHETAEWLQDFYLSINNEHAIGAGKS